MAGILHNIVATGGTATLTAKLGIGASGAYGAIETTIATLIATNTGGGDISISETNALSIDKIDQVGGGNIFVTLRVRSR